LPEIRKLQLTVKNLLHKGVEFYVKMLQNSPTNILNSKSFSGVILQDPRYRERGEKKTGEEGREEKGRVASWLFVGWTPLNQRYLN